MVDVLRVGIVGSRKRHSLKDRKLVFDIVDRLIEINKRREVIIISGACRLGADEFAAQAARAYKIKLIEFPVPNIRYESKRDYAVAAFSRNKTIAENSDCCFALVSDDRVGGTENTIKHFLEMNKKVFIVNVLGMIYLLKNEDGNASDVKRETDKT